MKYRLNQVNQEIKRLVSEIILREIETPKGALLTVTKVMTAPDLKHTKILIRISPATEEKRVFGYLIKNKPIIEKALAGRLTTKFTPKLRFEIDEQEGKAAQIEDLLDSLEIKKDDEE